MSKNNQPGDFCWNELMTGDVEQAKTFYKALFGWDSEEKELGDIIYTVFKQGDRGIAGMMQSPTGCEQSIPPHWMSYVCVNDIDQMAAKAIELGATIKYSPVSVEKFGKFVVLQDPTGAHMALWQSTEECDS